MKLDCVLSAVNENTIYIDFIPIFIETWKKLYTDIDIKIILIAKKIPEKYLCYKNNIILFEPIESVLTSFTSQFIRLLYPCILNYENGVMITDIDMLPMNRTYYTKNIELYDNNKFIYFLENILFNINQIAMCYNVATPNIWKDIFKIYSLEDIRTKIKNAFKNNNIKEGHGNSGWCTDQKFLYNSINNWKKKDNFVCLNMKKTKFKRLGRNRFNTLTEDIKKKISRGEYTDYHCHRPVSKYLNLINTVVELL